MENPQMVGGQIMEMPNEMFVLGRSGIHFTAKSRNHKFHGMGELLLSPLRIVFKANSSSGSSFFGGPSSNINGFDVPLATLYNESFNQPIFGANNLSGSSPPLPDSICEDDIHWCFTFKSGGVGTFLPIFFALLREMRIRMEAERRGETPSAPPVAVAVPAVVVAEIVSAAYIDPSDPTKLYVQQSPSGEPVKGKPVS